MKVPCLVILSLALPLAALNAQTNAGTNGVDSILALVTTNRPAESPDTNRSAAMKPRSPIFIEAAGPAVFDMDNHWVSYRDDVHVTDGQMKLTCDWLMANFPGNGEQPTNIVAETNVIADFTDARGRRERATGNKAVYHYEVQDGTTNETITLTGNPPQIQEGPGFTNRLTGNAIVYDLRTRLMTVTEPKGAYYPTNSPAGTNVQASDLPFSK